MVGAAAIAFMRQQFRITAGDYVHCAIGNGRGVDRGPHADALAPVLDVEISVVLMPRGAFTMTARLQKNLIQLPDNGIADQLADDIDHLVGKTERPEKLAFWSQWADLKIEGGGGFCLAISLPGDVMQQALGFKAFQFGLHGRDLFFSEEIRNGGVTVGTILGELFGSKLHGLVPNIIIAEKFASKIGHR
jgi:hypothetical protein